MLIKEDAMKKYDIIYADPPWQYRTYSKKGKGRSAESHYPTMSIEEIKALPVGELAAKGLCALYVDHLSMLAGGFGGYCGMGAFPIRPLPSCG